MFKLSEDGSRESTATKPTTWAFAYEGNIGLIGGLRKKYLCTKKGTVVDRGGKSSSLQGRKRINQHKQLKEMHEHEIKTTKI
jgi:hypothetical protein